MVRSRHPPSDRVTPPLPPSLLATIHRRVHTLAPNSWKCSASDLLRDRDLVVRFSPHHRCRNGSRVASAITWPRCAFAWKSESLNKPPTPALWLLRADRQATGRDSLSLFRRVHPRGWLPDPERLADFSPRLASRLAAVRSVGHVQPRACFPRPDEDEEGCYRTNPPCRTVRPIDARGEGAWYYGDLGPRPRRFPGPSRFTITSPPVCPSSSRCRAPARCSGWANCCSVWPPDGKSRC